MVFAKTVFVTGGAGFIGANFLNLFVDQRPDFHFVNLDKLTYAANPLSLKETSSRDNYTFERVDICDVEALNRTFAQYQPDWVIHFAAESHVDRSIHGPRNFIDTNIVGTCNLLEACRGNWPSFEDHIFHHVSTDEVYGELGDDGRFTETTSYDPSSPYSASKASSDHLVRAYHRTYGLPVKITNCSNNYGPFQFPEKLVPLMILNAKEGKPLPVYGDGKNVRDWLFVTDHCEAILNVVEKGVLGQTYNVGGGEERQNIEIVNAICDCVAEYQGVKASQKKELITFVKDRPGHDFRYAIDSSKLKNELGWSPKLDLEHGLKATVDWYLKHDKWVDQIRSGYYLEWIERNYATRDKI